MKITGLEIAAFSKPYATPISNGKYTYTATNIVTVQVLTDEGVTGLGWAHGGGIVLQTARELADYVIGHDPFNVERIWDRMYLPKVFGRKGLETRAISAVDIALWDIIGKVAGRPLYQLMGGYRDSVRAYVAGGYYGQNPADLGPLRDEVQQKLAKNPGALKMKVGMLSIAQDMRRVELVRELIGPERDLLVDANNAYDRRLALEMARALEAVRAYWFEEPLSPDDLEGCAALADAVDLPIAAGENEYTRWGFRDLINRGRIDVLNADAQVLGGITEWRKVAALASAYHLPVAPHGDQEIHTHLVCGVDNGLIVEYYDSDTNSLAALLLDGRVTMQDGYVRPPQGPGLGISLNYERAAPYRVA